MWPVPARVGKGKEDGHRLSQDTHTAIRYLLNLTSVLQGTVGTLASDLWPKVCSRIAHGRLYCALHCEHCGNTGGDVLSPTLGANNETVALAWLVSALEQARTQGQTKLVDYLEVVMEDVVFEMESAARSKRTGISAGPRVGPGSR